MLVNETSHLFNLFIGNEKILSEFTQKHKSKPFSTIVSDAIPSQGTKNDEWNNDVDVENSKLCQEAGKDDDGVSWDELA